MQTRPPVLSLIITPFAWPRVLSPMGQRAGTGTGYELLRCPWPSSHLHPWCSYCLSAPPDQASLLHFLRTLFWIRILNQLNSRIGRKAVCREPVRTPPPPSFWLAAGKGAWESSPQGPLSPTCPSAFQSALLTLSPGPSALEDSSGRGREGHMRREGEALLSPQLQKS